MMHMKRALPSNAGPARASILFITEDSLQTRMLMERIRRDNHCRCSTLPMGACSSLLRRIGPDVVVIDLAGLNQPLDAPGGIDSASWLDVAPDGITTVLINARGETPPLETRDNMVILSVEYPADLACQIIADAAADAADAATPSRRETVSGPVERLTATELAVVKRLKTGASNKALAGQLGVSIHTVKSHLYRIFGKLNCSNRSEAALWAQRMMP